MHECTLDREYFLREVLTVSVFFSELLSYDALELFVSTLFDRESCCLAVSSISYKILFALLEEFD